MRTAADGRSRETILKMAQSGHGLSLRLNMGDVRSCLRGLSHFEFMVTSKTKL